MKIYEAREAIASALDGENHAVWQGMTEEDRNEFAEALAYGEKTLQQVVDDFTEFCKRSYS